MLAIDPSIDIDVETGADINGWPHVLQCIADFFATRFGARVMREWYGSAVPAFLGENMNAQTIVPFFAALASAIEQWEPRFRITAVIPTSVNRSGQLRVTMEGEYRPRALLGDFTSAGARRVTLIGGRGAPIEVRNG